MNQTPKDAGESEELVPTSEDHEDEHDPLGVIDLVALRELEEIVPGAAEAFIKNIFAEAAHARTLEQEQAGHERAMALAQAEHERKLQEKALEMHELGNYRADDREKERNRLRRSGQLLAGLIASLALVVVGVALWTGSGVAPLALVIIATAILVGTVAGNQQQIKELRSQIDAFSRIVQQLSPASFKKLQDKGTTSTPRLPVSPASSSTSRKHTDPAEGEED